MLQVKKKRGKRSPVWEFFSEGMDESPICKACRKSLSNNKNTTNLIAHLKSHHPQLYQDFMNKSRSNEIPVTSNPPVKTNEIPIASASTSPSASLLSNENPSTSQATLPTGNNPPPGKRRKILDVKVIEKLDTAIANFIVTDLQSYDVVEGDGFKQMISAFNPNYNVPSRTTFSRDRIPKLYEQEKERVKNEIINQDVSFTTDNWTSEALEPYISITIHFIDQDWNLKALCLECRSMEDNHTAANLKDTILEILEEWDIPKERVVGCTTDNGSNVLKCTRLLNFKHISCFGHTLNIGVNHVLENLTFKNIIKKAKRLQNVFAHSWELKKQLGVIQETLGLPIRTLPSSCKTRWWSILKLLRIIIEQHQALVELFSTANKKKDYNDYLLEQNELDLLKSLVDVLTPLEALCTQLCGDKYITSSAIWPVIQTLKTDDFWMQQENTSNEREASYDNTDEPNLILSEMKDTINQTLNKYYVEPVEARYLLQKICFLDPRFKISYLDEDKEDIINYLKEEAENLELDNRNFEKEDEKITKKGLGSFLKKTVVHENRPKKTVISLEFESYASSSCLPIEDDPLQWWKMEARSKPMMAVLARKYLSMTGSSVPSERVFSTAGNIATEKRASLSPEHVNQLVFLAMNKKF